MSDHEEYAAEGENSEIEENRNEGTWLAKMLAERHALFDNVETASPDDDELPKERGASGANLRWAEVFGDHKLEKHLRGAAWRLQYKHKNSDLDAEDVAQRMRLRLYNGAAAFRRVNGLPEDHPLVFEKDREWTKYATSIIRNECARHSDRMEREAKAARLRVSRDSRSEKDVDGDEMHWRETLDYRAAKEELAHDERRMAIEAAIAMMPEPSRWIVEAFYRDGLSQRDIAAALGMPLSSFQRGPWPKMKADFIVAWRK